MAPTLLGWRIRTRHLAALVDRNSYDNSGYDYTGHFRLQDAQETEFGFIEGEDKSEDDFVS